MSHDEIYLLYGILINLFHFLILGKKLSEHSMGQKVKYDQTSSFVNKKSKKCSPRRNSLLALLLEG